MVQKLGNKGESYVEWEAGCSFKVTYFVATKVKGREDGDPALREGAQKQYGFIQRLERAALRLLPFFQGEETLN